MQKSKKWNVKITTIWQICRESVQSRADVAWWETGSEYVCGSGVVNAVGRGANVRGARGRGAGRGAQTSSRSDGGCDR